MAGRPNVIDIVRVTPIDEDVTGFELWREVRDGSVDCGRWAPSAISIVVFPVSSQDLEGS
jgi:hypothetical protein